MKRRRRRRLGYSFQKQWKRKYIPPTFCNL